MISTPRLDLIPFSLPFLEAALERDEERAARELGATLAEGWTDFERVYRRRRDQLREDPDVEPWLLRGIVLREARTMVGTIGFHGPPGLPELREYGRDAVEFGFTIFEPWRRRGLAHEASRALIDWAHREEGITTFLLSVDPGNGASRGLIEKLGFEKIDEVVDPEDGLEEVFRLKRGGQAAGG